jgi:beta-lactamase regulating signal transducer with metallopeptidase domain
MRGSFSFNIVMLFFITIYLFMCGGLNSNFILNIIYFILISIINNYFKYPVTGYIITTIVFILIFFNFFAVPVYASDMEGSNAADATASKSIQINNEFTTPLEELLQYELFLNILILLQIIFLLIIIFLYNNFISGTNN